MSDGAESLSSALAWAFGAGKVGQSFLFQREGRIYESRVSYYDAIHGLDFTPNRALSNPESTETAMARPIDEREVRRCFGCHTTASGTNPAEVDFSRLITGVTCEACHGPGRAHVAAVRAGLLDQARALIRDPRTLNPADSVDFCGSCHGTFWDVKLAGEHGIAALRSQPFRLESSRCWRAGDARLACVTCHDPHRPLVRDSASYDVRCTACHGVADGAGAKGAAAVSPSGAETRRPGAPVPDAGTAHADDATRSTLVCRVASKNCVSCHMPKYDVPGMHFRFTDHLIRVVRE